MEFSFSIEPYDNTFIATKFTCVTRLLLPLHVPLSIMISHNQVWNLSRVQFPSNFAVQIKTNNWQPYKQSSKRTPWASYQIRKTAGCACPGNAGNVFPATDLKETTSLRSRHASRTFHDACRDRYPAAAGKVFPALPVHPQPAILRIW